VLVEEKSTPKEQVAAEHHRAVGKLFDRGIWCVLGPGVTTGASDDDPSGIATYSQAGAAFGFALLWTLLLTLPLMAAIQEVSARIGRVTGRGIAGNLVRHYSKWFTVPLILILVIANVINLGADIEAMGAAIKLLIGGPAVVYSVALALLGVTLQVFAPYRKYASFCKVLAAVLLVYVAAVFFIHVPWLEVIRHTVIPTMPLTGSAMAMVIAVLGTTISPYLFFWQASQETEEICDDVSASSLKVSPHAARLQFARIRLDTITGMTLSNGVAFFIILTAAATLHARGVTNINTAEDAAKALQPIAGNAAFFLFTLGILGTGMLAVPVLAGSAAYAVGEAFNWRTGMDEPARKAPGFYGVMVAATLIGLGLTLIGVNPIKALIWSAVINGVAAVPIMVIVMLMFSNPRVMGRFAGTGRWLKIMGWIATAFMAAAAIGLFATWGK
jgi:NRAMP (natural resistance-associated macrophage protein)-like metal ion transporter